MSNITASDALVALRLPLYRHESKYLMKTDLPDLPDTWKQPPWPLARLFFIALCWFTLGKSNLEELWQDVIAKNRWEKCNFNCAVVGVAIAQNMVYVASIVVNRMDTGASSPCTLWTDLSLLWSGLGLLWFCFFVPLWFLEARYQYDDQLNWKPLPPAFVICYLGFLAIQQYVFLGSLSVFACGFFIAFLGDNFISYLVVADTIVILFVVFFGIMHRTSSQ
ncbi:hypothetical protein F4604DRAFT_1956480 [Suillus subluteus]|nr:hypothetical protein F4604DRAFT_1956480 [Suillus subluteus]